jgi:hypothetical protein
VGADGFHVSSPQCFLPTCRLNFWS